MKTDWFASEAETPTLNRRKNKAYDSARRASASLFSYTTHAHTCPACRAVINAVSSPWRILYLARLPNNSRYVVSLREVCTEKAVVSNELMRDLPDYQVCQSTRVFLHCGIDYASSIQIRSTDEDIKFTSRYSSVWPSKRYTSNWWAIVRPPWISAFNRFCACRSIPSNMYLDNATNF